MVFMNPSAPAGLSMIFFIPKYQKRLFEDDWHTSIDQIRLRLPLCCCCVVLVGFYQYIYFHGII